MVNDLSLMEVHPLKSMEIELRQLENFYKDLVTLVDATGEEYLSELKWLRDSTNLVRGEYASVYSKILVEHEDLNKLI